MQTNGQKDPDVTDRILKYHNDARAAHGAAPLTWSSTLAQNAQVSTATRLGAPLTSREIVAATRPAS